MPPSWVLAEHIREFLIQVAACGVPVAVSTWWMCASLVPIQNSLDNVLTTMKEIRQELRKEERQDLRGGPEERQDLGKEMRQDLEEKVSSTPPTSLHFLHCVLTGVGLGYLVSLPGYLV